MDKLERLLSNPDSHGETPSDEQVRAWGSKALERWAVENQDVHKTSSAPHGVVDRVKDGIYWLGAAACLAYLIYLLFDYVSGVSAGFRDLELNLPTASDFSLMLRTYSLSIAIVICGIAFAATRPVREFFLRQLG